MSRGSSAVLRIAIVALICGADTRARAQPQPPAQASAEVAPQVTTPVAPPLPTPPVDSADPYAHDYPYAPGLPDTRAYHVPERSGLAFGVGIGDQFGGGLGAHLAYYLKLSQSRWAFVPYAGGGWLFTKDAFAPAFGMMGMYGAHGRLVLDAGFGGSGVYTLYVHGVGVATRVAYAAHVGAGFEWMGTTGFLLRVLASVGLRTNRFLFDDVSDRFAIGLTFGLGHKLW